MIHYNEDRTHSVGVCGEPGIASPHVGAVTCPRCKDAARRTKLERSHDEIEQLKAQLAEARTKLQQSEQRQEKQSIELTEKLVTLAIRIGYHVKALKTLGARHKALRFGLPTPTYDTLRAWAERIGAAAVEQMSCVRESEMAQCSCCGEILDFAGDGHSEKCLAFLVTSTFPLNETNVVEYVRREALYRWQFMAREALRMLTSNDVSGAKKLLSNVVSQIEAKDDYVPRSELEAAERRVGELRAACVKLMQGPYTLYCRVCDTSNGHHTPECIVGNALGKEGE